MQRVGRQRLTKRQTRRGDQDGFYRLSWQDLIMDWTWKVRKKELGQLYGVGDVIKEKISKGGNQYSGFLHSFCLSCF